MSIQNEKSHLRQKMRIVLKRQSFAEREKKNGIIFKKLCQDTAFRKSKVIMFYVSKEEEADTRKLMEFALRKGKVVLVPFVRGGDGDGQSQDEIIPVEIKDIHMDLAQGPYGIDQPKVFKPWLLPMKHIDLILVPALAFDYDHYRLGRGKGYYDRFLAKISSGCKSYGLAFDIQMLSKVPRDLNDLPVHLVVHN